MRSHEVFGERKGNSADGFGVLSKPIGGMELTRPSFTHGV